MTIALTKLQADLLRATCLAYAHGYHLTTPRDATAAAHLQILGLIRIDTGPVLRAFPTSAGHAWVRDLYLQRIPEGAQR